MVASVNHPILPPTQVTIGCILLGVGVALLLSGILLCQGYSYFRTYRDDPKAIKLTVAVILLANAANLGLAMHVSCYYIVLNYQESDLFTHVPISVILTPISILLCISPCQYVHTRRTFLILPQRCQWAFVGLAVLLYSSAAALIVVLTVRVASIPRPFEFEQWLRYKWLVSAAFGFSVVGDMALACILGVVLHVSRTGLKRTDAVLNAIIASAFRSAIFTSMLSLLCLLVAVFEGKNMFVAPLSLAVAKLYGNTTLVTLNIRRDMWEMFQAPPGSDFLFGSLSVFRRRDATQPEGGIGSSARE